MRSLLLLALGMVLMSGCTMSTDDLYVVEHTRAAPGSPCSTDADCNDNLQCNGIERCGSVSGVCVREEAPSCTEGFPSCVFSRCEEPIGTCTPTPNNAMCPVGFECDVGRGCIRSCDTPPGQICDPEAGCGCAPGESCFIVGGRARCGPQDAIEEGFPCVRGGAPACVEGLTCLSSQREGITTCQQVCTADAECGEGVCSPSLALSGENVCTPFCSLFESNTCPGLTRCTILGRASPNVIGTACSVGGPAGDNQACERDSDCLPGLLCVNTSGRRVCLNLCRNDSDCPRRGRCGIFDPVQSYEGEEVGPCL